MVHDLLGVDILGQLVVPWRLLLAGTAQGSVDERARVRGDRVPRRDDATPVAAGRALVRCRRRQVGAGVRAVEVLGG